MSPPKYEFLGQGRTRKVFRRGNVVVKIPLNEKGFLDNAMEAGMYRKYGKKGDIVPYARCRLTRAGFLVMEYVAPVARGFVAPDWAGFVDCCQVGHNSKGELLAYDYGG